MMERQAEDGTIYQQVGPDHWSPVTREAADGTVYKKVGPDHWSPLEAPKPAAKPEPDHYFGPGGKIPQWLDESPNAKTIVKGTLEQAPVLGSILGGSAGGVAGLIEGAPTAGAASVPLAVAQGFAGAGLGAGIGKSLENYGRAELLGESRSTKDSLLEPIEAIPEGMMYHGVGEVAAPVIKGTAKALGKGASFAAKRGMTTFLGPSGEAIETYLKRPGPIREAINGKNSLESIKNQVDEAVSGLFDDAAAAKLARDESKAAVKDVEGQIREAARDGRLQFQIKQADAKEAMKEARSRLDSAFGLEKDKLTAIKSPIHLADEVQAALQEGKQQVSKLSKEGYEILGNHPDPVSIREPFRAIGRAAKELDIAGTGPLTDEAIAAQQKLMTLADRVGKMPVNIPATEAKKAIQQLDSAIDYGVRNGAFTSEVQQALKGLRRGLDEQLKQVPGYAEKMAEASQLAKILEQTSEGFGTPQLAVSKLNSIAGRTAGPARDTLGALGSATGRDFLSPIDQFVQAQGVLKDPRALEGIKRGLPEFKNARLQEFGYYKGQRPEETNAFIENFVNQRGLNAQRAAAEGKLSQAEAELLQKQEAAKPFKALANSSQSRIQSVMKPAGKEDIETREALQKLGQIAKIDFLQLINDRRIANQFKGEYRNGSRNVVLFSALFGSAHPALIPVGAAIGAAVDRFGPEIAQTALNQIVKANGVISKETIAQMALPQEVKAFLSMQLVKSEGKAIQTLPRAADTNELDKDSGVPANYKTYPDGSMNDVPKRGPEKWLQDGYSKLMASADLQTSQALAARAGELTKSAKGRHLLMAASDLKPGSSSMKRIMSQIKNELEKSQG